MFIIPGVLAFVSEYLDSGLGMGYGTVLAPALVLLGYDPLKVVPAILISQLVTDIASCFAHHSLSNVDLRPWSADLKTALLLGGVSSLGVILSVVVALNIPKWFLAFYIGLLVTSMGILILATTKRPMAFSWHKIAGVSFLAAFNKGISGGGYGPLVMGGQMLSGVRAKNAVGITSFAEAVTCLVGFALYLALGKDIDWKLTLQLVLFATGAVPVAAVTVRRIDGARLKKYAGIFITLLGLITLFKMIPGA